MNTKGMGDFCRNFANLISLGIVLLIFCTLLNKVSSQTIATTSTTGKPDQTTGKPPITTKSGTRPTITIGPVDDDDESDAFDAVTEGENGSEVVAVVEKEVGAAPDKKKSAKDSEHNKEKLKEKMALDLTESTGKDWGDLSAMILNTAWANNGNRTAISVLALMQWFENTGGEERLHLIRLLELMDKDMNGLISKEEFVSTYSGPLASPDKAIELLHRVNDYDGNGFISLWETLTQILIVDGINRNIYDKYTQAAHTNRIMDSNRDLFVSLHEFTNYMVWQMNRGIGLLKTFPKGAGDGDISYL